MGVQSEHFYHYRVNLSSKKNFPYQHINTILIWKILPNTEIIKAEN